MKKCCIFSCKGLGDGLINLVLGYNLFLNDYKVTLYHDNHLDDLQSWFSYITILPFPVDGLASQIYEENDLVFIAYDKSNPFLMALIQDGKTTCPSKTYVLNPSVTTKIGSQPYYGDTKFNPGIPMVENMVNFCSHILKLNKVTIFNGFSPPSLLQNRRYINRLIIHPTSANEFEPVLVMTDKEIQQLKNDTKALSYVKTFSNLDELASFVFESGYMIGNDSGIGHLASMLGLPSITICRNPRVFDLWRPGWQKNIGIYPSKKIPNISGFRIRDQLWKRLIGPKKVLKRFLDLKTTC